MDRRNRPAPTRYATARNWEALPILTSKHLSFFRDGATVADAAAKWRNSRDWWSAAIGIAEERGYIESPGRGPRWWLTERGEVRVHMLAGKKVA